MPKARKTSPKVATTASKILREAYNRAVKSVAGSALSQAAPKKKKKK
jgi:hypothetical protein